jgi:cytochrome c peroxidase
LVAVFAALGFYPSRPAPPEVSVARLLSSQVAAFDSLVERRFVTAVGNGAGQDEVQRLFLEARLTYKRWEWAAEYWNPLLARQLNGEPVPETDPVIQADPTPEGGNPGRFRVVTPEGLQVIEGLLFPRYDTARRQELLDLLRRIRVTDGWYLRYFGGVGLLPGQVFDAAKLEVFRVMSLGVTGFDDPLTLRSMRESAEALKGVRDAMGAYGLGSITDPAIDYLSGHTGFDTFDRAAFVTDYANPLTTAITKAVSSLNIPVIRYNRLLRQDVSTLFDRDAFNPDAYLPEGGVPTGAALVALGRKLFYDPSLSATGTRSCGSCHQPEQAFTDGLVRNTILDSHDPLARNTPTLLNAALQPALFYDLRASSLEDQIEDVLHNSLEMRGSLSRAMGHFAGDTAYRRLFNGAFATGAPDTTGIVSALAAYVRSLVRLDSRFDDYMRGEPGALDTMEIRGFNLFMGKARCGTCHYIPLFNGNFPPMYDRIEAEVIGVPASRGAGVVDPDPGQFGILPASFLRHAFKTPTVREAGRTAPYMHNGVFSTLAEVVDFYNDGGGRGEGERLDNQTLPADSLRLTAGDKKALIRFLESLNSR